MKLTYYGPTQPIDDCYRPAIRLETRYEKHFNPIYVTDAGGAPHFDIAADMLNSYRIGATASPRPELSIN